MLLSSGSSSELSDGGPWEVQLVGWSTSYRDDIHNEMFVHKSGGYATGKGASGTVPTVCFRGSPVAVGTPTHDSDLELEK